MKSKTQQPETSQMKYVKLTLIGTTIVACLLLTAATDAQTLTVTNGLQLWMRADAGVTTNSAGGVTGWADQSTNHNDAVQSDDTLAPLLVPGAQNGKPVVHFDGTDDYLDIAPAPSIAIAGDISTFFVVKFDDFATYRAVWAQTVRNLPGPNDYYLLPNTGIPRAYRGDGTSASLGNVDGTTPIRAGGFVVLGFQMAGTNLTHYLNGQAIGSGTITATLADGGGTLRIGSRDDLVTKMKGDIAELVIFDRSLALAERNTVVNYLQTKYGIVNQAPTINISSPANNSSVAAPATITLTANAADADGVVAKVDFFANGVLVATASAPPYRLQLRIESGGTVVLGAVATDNKDAIAAATNVTITATSTGTPTLMATNRLQLWLSADAGVTKDANGAVSVWKDQSGNGNDAAQPSESSAPIFVDNAVNGRPVLRFDGTDDYLDVASSPGLAITGDIASFFVARFTDFATFRAIWGKTAGNVPRPNDYYLLPNTGVPRVYRGSDVGAVNQSTDGARVAAGVYVLLGFNQSGTTMTHYFNGQPSGTGQLTVTPTDSGTPLKIGSRDDFVTKMKGEIAEVLIYDKALSDSERGAVAAYLGAKYGIPIIQPTNGLPTVSLTAPSGGGTIAAPTNLTATATAADPDGSVVKVDFFANGGLVGSATRTPYRADFLVPTAGPVSLTTVATDNLGGKTTSASIAVTATSTAPSTLPVTSGLQLWLKADAGVTASGAGLVSSWADFSGNFNNAFQADSTAAPLLVAKGLNQLPTLRFDGANDYLEIAHAPSLANTGDITSLFVAKFDDFATFRAVWAKTASNLPRSTDYHLLPNTGVPRLIRGGPAGIQSSDSAEPILAGTFVIAGFEMAGTEVTHYLDGAAVGSGNITSTLVDAGNPVRIGTRGDLVTKMKGDIAEILIYNTALTDPDRNKVIDYLRAKYFAQATQVQPRFTAIKNQGNLMTIEWESNATLEEAAQVTGPWTPVANAKSPFAVTNTGARKFYRLRL
jgi:hypothetical protein